MAGEWIKVDVSLLDKPEVMRMGRRLQENKHLVVGSLILFWVWLDKHSVDGVVDGVTSHDIDTVVDRVGFADAMAAVGWLKFDDEREHIEVPNFARHNGESAKKRALKNARQARWREKSGDAAASTNASTREEKRRSNTSVGSKALPTALTAPTEKHRALAKQLGVDCDLEFAAFTDRVAAKGPWFKVAEPAFANWLRQEHKYAKRDGRASAQGTPAAGRVD